MEKRTSHLTKLDQISVGERTMGEKERGEKREKKNKEREAPHSL